MSTAELQRPPEVLGTPEGRPIRRGVALLGVLALVVGGVGGYLLRWGTAPTKTTVRTALPAGITISVTGEVVDTYVSDAKGSTIGGLVTAPSFRAGDVVVVRDASTSRATVLGRTTLSKVRSVDTDAAWFISRSDTYAFTLSALPATQLYSVTVGSHGPYTYTWDDLRAASWRISITPRS